MFTMDGRDNEVFTNVVSYVTSVHTELTVTDNFSSVYNDTPSNFPHISGWFISDEEDTKGIDNTLIENFTNVGFEWNIYSNKQNGKKEEVSELANLVDTAMRRLGFARTMGVPVPNYADATIERRTLRYSAKIGKDGKVYRR